MYWAWSIQVLVANDRPAESKSSTTSNHNNNNNHNPIQSPTRPPKKSKKLTQVEKIVFQDSRRFPRVVGWNGGAELVLDPQPTRPLLYKDQPNNATNATTTLSSEMLENPVPSELPECVAGAAWQTESHPNCNAFHEYIDSYSLLIQSPPPKPATTTTTKTKDTTTVLTADALEFLGQGWFRSVWKYQYNHPVVETSKKSHSKKTSLVSDTVVLKVLRYEREFLEEYYELHRRDAVAMDHLTFSPYVMNVYGYCGQSALNEFADFVLPGLEQVDRRLRDQKITLDLLLLKLRVALSVAIGVYHVQYGRPGMPWDHEKKRKRENHHHEEDILPTMVHYDLNPRNIAMVSGGTPKLNDFNIAEFLQVRRTNTSQLCGFPSRLSEPWWRAPEEVEREKHSLVSAPVDIYALGNVLFHILTTHAPRGKMNAGRMDSVRQQVIQGIPPTLMEPWASAKDPITRAFRRAMDVCYQADPQKRGTSGQVATILHEGWKDAVAMKEKMKK
eukprot:Nitzschia sp. Nitz4//scaffold227_size32659//10018//11520//NITZ4_007897-RA/size32659-processed-gene-0.6-mRNA-1//-1//CDS//3329542791//1999//frame0